jgi:hypothetical protein
MAGALKAPARPGGVVVAARGKSRKRDAAMPIIKKVGCIGGGVVLGFITERVLNPETTFGKAAVNGGASAVGAFGLSAAFDRNSKMLNTITAGTIGVAVGSRDKLSEWGDWLKNKINGQSANSTSTPKIGEKRADGKTWNGSAWVSVVDTQRTDGGFSATPTPTQTTAPGPTYITVEAPKTEKKSTFETIFSGLTDAAGKILPGLLQGTLGSGRSMIRAY